MPVLPLVASSSATPSRNLPVLIPSRTMREAARSFTDPPGLAHSALANISIAENCAEIFSSRSSGVLPMRWSKVSPNADAAFAAVFKPVGTKLVNGRFAEPGILCESVHSVVYARAGMAGNATAKSRIRLQSLEVYVTTSSRAQLRRRRSVAARSWLRHPGSTGDGEARVPEEVRCFGGDPAGWRWREGVRASRLPYSRRDFEAGGPWIPEV